MPSVWCSNWEVQGKAEHAVRHLCRLAGAGGMQAYAEIWPRSLFTVVSFTATLSLCCYAGDTAAADDQVWQAVRHVLCTQELAG